ncbi:MAG: hypothetical protein O3C29_03785 [Proteobacteria bacterium]|nr:hypothetical protein [Pseudomonadota bacterium]MDA1291191.1 hypothetical protein [Pseudomonadota bacterium]
MCHLDVNLDHISAIEKAGIITDLTPEAELGNLTLLAKQTAEALSEINSLTVKTSANFSDSTLTSQVHALSNMAKLQSLAQGGLASAIRDDTSKDLSSIVANYSGTMLSDKSKGVRLGTLDGLIDASEGFSTDADAVAAAEAAAQAAAEVAAAEAAAQATAEVAAAEAAALKDKVISVPDNTASYFFHEILVLITGAPAQAGSRDLLQDLLLKDSSWGSVGTYVDNYLGARQAQHPAGEIGVIKEIAGNGLGLRLSDQQAQDALTVLNQAGCYSWSERIGYVITKSFAQ